MASKTANYNLDMPAYNEIADIDVINGNMDKIDVQMKKNADSAQQSKDIVSDEYSATNTYAVGDYCIHENILYKCKTAITTGEAFDSNKWVQTTCGTEFGELNSNLDGLGYGENGAYNLINPTLQTTTINDVTCTSNGDGIYTLNGSSETFSSFKLADVYLEKGTYLIDSFSYDGDNPYLWIGKDGELNNIINTYWTQPFTFTLDSKTLVSICMVCTPGQNFSDKLMFPMLINGTSSQKQYKPYIPSVKMLADEISAQNESLGAYAITNDMLESGNWWNGGNTSNEHIRVKKEYALQSGFKGYVTNNTGKLLSVVNYTGDTFVGSALDIAVDSTVLVEVPSGSNYRMYEAETDFSNIASNIIVATNGLGKEVAKLKNDLGGLSFSVSGTTLSITDGTNTWTLSN